MKQVYETEQELVHIFQSMERRGICVDLDYVQRAIRHEEHNLQKAFERFEQDTGEPFKDSPKLFSRIFNRRNEPFPYTKKGNPSFEHSFLKTLDSPTAKLITEIRQIQKNLGFYYSYKYFARENNGLYTIHPEINQAAASTGRISYSDPNLQQCPKEEDENLDFYVRRSFVPRPGKYFVAIDYEQQEFRILLDYAGEKKVIKEIKEGGEIHETMSKVLGVNRKRGKTLSFAILYGVGIGKLSIMLGVSENEASDLKRKYFSRFPKVSELIKNIKRKAKKRGYVFNQFGRRFYLDDSRFDYKLPNHLIQGTGADVVKRAIPASNNILKDCENSFPLLQVHDELLFEFDENDLGKIPSICEAMQNVYKPFNGLSLEVGVEYSTESWANMKNSLEEIKGEKAMQN